MKENGEKNMYMTGIVLYKIEIGGEVILVKDGRNNRRNEG